MVHSIRSFFFLLLFLDGNTSSNDEDLVLKTDIKLEMECDSNSNCSSTRSSKFQDYHTVSNMVSTLSLHEESLVTSLVELEAKSRDEVPMSPKTMKGIMDSLQTGGCLQYAVAKEGYNTAVQRVAHFISKVDLFRDFDLDDRRALIGKCLLLDFPDKMWF